MKALKIIDVAKNRVYWSLRSAVEILKASIRREIKGAGLTIVKTDLTLKRGTHVVVMVVRNEFSRIPYFLCYYRKMGFKHFLIIDNLSDDGTRELLSSEDGVTLYYTSSSYKESRYGNDWINYVLSRHCHNKWILYVDADELLVYPNEERATIDVLTDYLTRCGIEKLDCLMIDMYSDKNADDNICEPGKNPLEVCDLFDTTGYVKYFEAATNTCWIKGGVRGRIFFAKDLSMGPALNKIPLVRWRRGYVFLKSAHQLWPFRLNSDAASANGKISGALMHFKFISASSVNLVDPQILKQHTSEYNTYINVAYKGSFLMKGNTYRFSSSCDFIASGLISGQDWLEY